MADKKETSGKTVTAGADPHTHTTSLEQHNAQVALIIINLETISMELKKYRDLQNSTMIPVITKKLVQAKSQLQQKMAEVPPKDREQDIYNNKWCRECLPSKK